MLDAMPSKMSSVAVFLNEYIIGHIITGFIIDVKSRFLEFHRCWGEIQNQVRLRLASPASVAGAACAPRTKRDRRNLSGSTFC